VDEIVIGAGEKAKRLIFVFHGYGADKENLLPVGQSFADHLADVEVHVADGPEVCDGGFGRQWFSLVGDDPLLWYEAFDRNKSLITSYVDSIVKPKGWGYENVVLTGFSQGGMLSLSLGLELGVSAIVVFSGLLIAPQAKVKNNNTRILLTHGRLDTVVPISGMQATADYLGGIGLEVQTVVGEKNGHSIDYQSLVGAIDFLRK
jgi:phospholipase/carboxylesterase